MNRQLSDQKGTPGFGSLTSRGFQSTFFLTTLIVVLCFHLQAHSQTTTIDSIENSSTTNLPVLQKNEQTIRLDDTTGITQNSTPENKHVYRINYWVSIPFSLVATAADVYAIPNIIKAKKGITDEELASLNPNAHSNFDKWALRQDPTKRDDYYKASDYMLPIIIASAATLGFDKKIRKDAIRLLMIYYEMHCVTFSVYNFSPFGPAFQNKIRPVAYYDYYPAGDRQVGNNRNSLYSGHTATAVASTFFMVKVYSDYHPEIGRKKYLLYTMATIPGLVEGYLRMKALAHFPSDILVGVAIGGVCGVLVPDLHKFRNPNMKLGVINTPMGPGLSFRWSPNYERKENYNRFSPGVQ